MFFNYEGQRLPQLPLQLVSESGWQKLSTAALFGHRTVIVFAVLGAFTRPHSAAQLAGYNQCADAFRAQGVDEIICLAVNDPFSLAAWARTEQADQVRFIADASGTFTRELGMLVNFSDQCMGQRSWRYSMLVRDQTIEKMFIERDGFETAPVVADAATMLHYLTAATAPSARTAVLMHLWRTIHSA